MLRRSSGQQELEHNALTLICEWCGQPYTTYRSSRRYCGSACYGKAQEGRSKANLHLARAEEAGLSESAVRGLYTGDGKPVRQCAEEAGVSRNTFAFLLGQFGIPTRGRSDAAKLRSARTEYQAKRSASLRDTHVARPELRKRMSERAQAAYGGCGNPRWIETPCREETWLRVHYEQEGLSASKCAQLAGCGENTLLRWLKEAGIKVRRQRAPVVFCEVCGKRRDPENRRFCSPQCAGKGNAERRRGAGSPTWKGGRSGERGLWCGNGGMAWRRAVLRAANKRCEFCGESKRPCGHHRAGFTEYPQYRDDPANGLCLCFDCHSWLHSGVGAERREAIEREYLWVVGAS